MERDQYVLNKGGAITAGAHGGCAAEASDTAPASYCGVPGCACSCLTGIGNRVEALMIGKRVPISGVRSAAASECVHGWMEGGVD